ncbi:MAG: mechanosensitive ion channel [Planctomycetota bacterium]
MQIFSQEALSMLYTRFIDFLPNLASAIALVGVFWLLLVIARRLMRGALRRAKVPDTMESLMNRFLKYGVILVAAITIAGQLHINVTSMVAGLGIAGLAISFAAQDTISNIISGITLVIDRPFTEGDWVQVGDTHAQVSKLRLRTTVLNTFDGETIVIPNQNISQEKVVNYTLTPRTRVRVPVGIAYKEDIREARRIMLSTVEGDDRLEDEPQPMVVVTGLGDSSVNLELRFWATEAMQKFPLTWEYTEKCKRALDEADIEIPFPHRQLFLERSEGLSELSGAGYEA